MMKSRCYLAAFLCLMSTQIYAANLSAYVTGKVISAQVLAEKNKLPDAIKILSSIHSSSAYDKAYVNRMLGVYYWRTGDRNKAIASLKAAVQSHEFDGKDGWTTEKMLADILLTDEKYDEALPHYQHLTQSVPKGENASELWLRMSQIYYRLAKWPDVLTAMAHYEQYHNPDKSQPLIIKVTAENELKRYDAAIDTTKRLIVLEPDNRNWWLQLVGFEMNLKHYREALNSLALAQANHVDLNRHDQILLAELYAQNGIPESAARTLSAVPHIHKNEKLLTQLASYWQQAKEWQQSANIWAKLTRFDNKYYWNLAQVSLQMRDYPQVLTALNHYKAPDDKIRRQVQLVRIQVLYRSNNIELALKEARKADQEQSTKQTQSWIKYLTQLQRYSGESA